MEYKEETLQQYAIGEVSHFNWRAQENDLIRWWLWQAEQTETLTTIDGERIIVLDAGQRNHGPGPDIFRSRILLDDFEISGDVEMHLNAGDWYVHGHHSDERYRDVILHIILDGDAGPDIPTLKVARQSIGAGKCHANRPIIGDELIAHAYYRFRRKEKHLKLLAQHGHGNSPLFLGMIEIIMAGGSRFQWLQQAANLLGMNHWPDCHAWEGSNLSHPHSASKSLLLSAIMGASEMFGPEKWLSSSEESWSDEVMELRSLGLSLNLCLEWQVNILAPFMRGEPGFLLWQNMKIFRHYGLEKEMLPRLGLSKLRGVAEQQGLLEWKRNYCSKGSCSNCPLIQYHHTLTHIN